MNVDPISEGNIENLEAKDSRGTKKFRVPLSRPLPTSKILKSKIAEVFKLDNVTNWTLTVISITALFLIICVFSLFISNNMKNMLFFSSLASSILFTGLKTYSLLKLQSSKEKLINNMILRQSFYYLSSLAYERSYYGKQLGIFTIFNSGFEFCNTAVNDRQMDFAVISDFLIFISTITMFCQAKTPSKNENKIQ